MKHYYDIKYVAPSGSNGIMYALLAESIEEAASLCPILLSSNSPYSPDMFEVLSVEETPEENKPR